MAERLCDKPPVTWIHTMQNHMTSRKTAILIIFGLLAAALAGCSVVSKNTRQEAVAEINFAALKRNADEYVGKTVILGGYILEVENLADQTRLMVLQAPLNFRDEPGSRDRSQGRFRVVHPGFLDPAVYRKDRKITVAGVVTGTEKIRINKHEYILPVLRAREIHLWQKPPQPPEYPYPYDPFHPWAGPGFWYWHHPYFRGEWR